MRNKLIIYLLSITWLLITACREKTEREWFSKDVNISIKICVKDSCDIIIINDEDSIFTKHNRIYYQFYTFHFIDGSDSLYIIDGAFYIKKVKQNKYNISVLQPDTIDFMVDPYKILNKKGFTIQGGENGRFDLFVNKEYVGKIPLISMK